MESTSMGRHCNYTNLVSRFNEAFGVNNDKAHLYKKLITEEYAEFIEAVGEGNAEHQLKELCDLLYVAFGYGIQRGWDMEVAFNRVHASNMSKLDKDGKPIYNEHGKVQKSELYFSPNLKDLVCETQ